MSQLRYQVLYLLIFAFISPALSQVQSVEVEGDPNASVGIIEAPQADQSFQKKSELANVWTKQTPISQAIAFEKSLNENMKISVQNVSLSPDYYPLLNKYPVTNPLIVKRKSSGYLPVYAEYFYTPKDSTLRLVSYDWEKDKYGNFFAKRKLWQEESKKFEIYDQEYEQIKAALIHQIGMPSTDDKKAQVVKGGRGDYLTRSAIWESEAVHADLNLIFEPDQVYALLEKLTVFINESINVRPFLILYDKLTGPNNYAK